MIDPIDKAYAEETSARYDKAAKRIRDLNLQVGDEAPLADHEDAIAHLYAMPRAHAIAKAREWTGRDDIRSLDEAVEAVRELLMGGDTNEGTR